jgi:hypothetical protein
MPYLIMDTKPRSRYLRCTTHSEISWFIRCGIRRSRDHGAVGAAAGPGGAVAYRKLRLAICARDLFIIHTYLSFAGAFPAASQA